MTASTDWLNRGELWPWARQALRVEGGHSKRLYRWHGEGVKFTFVSFQSNQCVCSQTRGGSKLTLVFRQSRVDAHQACAVWHSAIHRPLGFYKPKARSYKTCAELHKPIYFCTRCCRTFSTRGPLWCLPKISNAGLVMTKCVTIPVCSDVLC